MKVGPLADEMTVAAPAIGAEDEVALRVAAALRPGWTLLQDCAFDGTGAAAAPARARFALLHPHVGIALLDLQPGARDPAAADRLRRALDAVEFAGVFGGHPPVVHLHLAARSLPQLRARLDRAFDMGPPLALLGGDAWVAAARGVLGGRPAAQPAVPEDGPGGGDAPPREAAGTWTDAPGPGPGPSAPRKGLRALGLFWAGLLLALAGGAAVLQHLGPPEDHAAAGPGAPRDGGGATVPPAAAEADAAGTAAAVAHRSPPLRPAAPASPAPMPGPAGGAGPAAGSGDGAAKDHGARAAAPADPGLADPTPSLAALLRELSETLPMPALLRGAGEPPPVPAPAPPAPVEVAVWSDRDLATGGGGAPVPVASASQVGGAEGGTEPAAAPAGRAAGIAEDAPAPAAGPPVAEAAGQALGGGAPPVPEEGAAPSRPAGATALGGEARPSLAAAPGLPGPPRDLARGEGGARHDAAVAEMEGPSGPPAASAAAPVGAGAGRGAPAAAPDAARAEAWPPQPTATAPRLSTAVLDTLMRRGDAMAASGDISAARLLYGRAAAAGQGRAAMALARTYDPGVLAGIAAAYHADPAMAAAWYSRAAALGEAEARAWLERHGGVAAAD